MQSTFQVGEIASERALRRYKQRFKKMNEEQSNGAWLEGISLMGRGGWPFYMAPVFSSLLQTLCLLFILPLAIHSYFTSLVLAIILVCDPSLFLVSCTGSY